MDDSDLEILGIPIDDRRKEATVSQSNKSSKKFVKDKLKETELFRHHTAAAKSSHSRKKRRKTYAERNNKKSRHEKKSNKAGYPMLPDPHKPLPLITQSRITTNIGIYNKAKKSDKILRDLEISDAVQEKTNKVLKKILDVSAANLPPAPNLDSPLILDDTDVGLVQVVHHSPPESLVPVTKPAPKPPQNLVPAIHPQKSDNKGLTIHGEKKLEVPTSHARNHIPMQVTSSPELSPISEAAEMIEKSFSLNSVFPGRDYLSDIKDSLMKQLHKQRQSSALKTPRKSHIQTRRHSSVKKNLNPEFDRKSGGTQSSSMSIDRGLQHSDIVRRSDLIPKSRSPLSTVTEPVKPHMPRGSASSMPVSHLPHTVAAPPPSSMQVNAFEECARTLKNQPPVDISVDDFFPRVETQMLHREHEVDMLDYIQLSCSSNSETLSYPDPCCMVGNIVPVSALIYPPHLDPTLPIQEAERCVKSGRTRHQHGAMLQKGKYRPYVSGSEEDSPMYSLPLPPPPVLPPSSPSPPQMFRQRMY